MMTWLDPFDTNRLSHLFDVAADQSDEPLSALMADERAAVEEIRTLLDIIDASWQITDTEHDRIDRLFYQKLAAKQPDHPWVRGSVVRTLGELMLAIGEDRPPVPPASYAQLASDPTPIQALLDVQQRTKAVGMALRRAGVPTTTIGEFMLWLSRTVQALIPAPGTTPHGMVYTRRQGGRGGRKP
jgi:hypothetical protein